MSQTIHTAHRPASDNAERMAFVDGLRGLAALVVAVGHIIGMAPPDHPATTFLHAAWRERLVWPWLFGGQAVWLFIMLSGFALYWSEERRVLAGRGATSLRVYAARRCWRILPTYYVSLALGLIVIEGLGPWLLPPSASLQTFAPVTPGGLASHLVLIHNLDPSWIHQINPPLWSIAVEAQLYLLFPALAWAGMRWRPYLPAVVLVAGVTVIGMASPVRPFGLAAWFAVGAVLAHVARRHQIPRRALLLVAGAAGAVGWYLGPAATGQLAQAVWLVAFAALLLALAQTSASRWNAATWSASTWLGKVSYSLYAVHFPVALLVWAVVGRLDLPGPAVTPVLALVGLIASLVGASLCYRLVEAPSLTRVRAVAIGSQQKAVQRQTSAARAMPWT